MARYKQGAVILVVEDDPGDAAMIRDAFELALPAPRVTVVSHGEQALDLLRQPADADGPRPDLILLDLDLPSRSDLAALGGWCFSRVAVRQVR